MEKGCHAVYIQTRTRFCKLVDCFLTAIIFHFKLSRCLFQALLPRLEDLKLICHLTIHTCHLAQHRDMSVWLGRRAGETRAVNPDTYCEISMLR